MAIETTIATRVISAVSVLTKTLQYLQVDLEKQEPLEEAETAATIASFSSSKNATLCEIELVDWVETSLIIPRWRN
jgi:hypothetical protein